MGSSLGTRLRRASRWMFDGQRAVQVTVAMVLIVDVMLALIHVVVMAAFDAPDIWRIDMDGSYGEAYQYAKYVWIIGLLAFYAISQRNWPVAAWIPLITYFVVDDAALLHEQAGYWYSGQSWAFGLGPVSAQNVGELALSAAVGLVLLAVIVIGYVRADLRTRWIFRMLIALVVALLVFAVVVDVIHGFVMNIRILDRGLGFAEDLGEMLVLSLIVAFCLRINVSGGQPGFSDTSTTSVSAPTRRSLRARS